MFYWWVWCSIFPSLRREYELMFVVYGSQKDKEDGWPDLVIRLLTWYEQRRKQKDPGYQLLIPLSWIHEGPKTTGIIMATYRTREEFDENVALAAEVAHQLQRDYPQVKYAPMAGQFGKWLSLASRDAQVDFSMSEPFTDGLLGTLFLLKQGTDRLFEKFDLLPAATTVAVLGGKGHIGGPLVRHLGAYCKEVIAVDPRFGEGRKEGAILETSVPSSVAHADVIISLLPNDIHLQEYVPFFKEGVILATDAHPGASYETLGLIREKTEYHFQYKLRHPSVKTLPAMPGYQEDDIVGCMFTGQVYSRSSEAFEYTLANEPFSQQYEKFMRTARKEGFEAVVEIPYRARGFGFIDPKPTPPYRTLSWRDHARKLWESIKKGGIL
jgi:hypothetical protein